MTVCVWTPTCRFGGLDVTVASIKRQHRRDLVWIVGDELYQQRFDIVTKHAPCDVLAFDTARIREKTGMPRSLSAANNEALRIARALGARMLVCLNDYVWAPPDGIDQFLRLADRYPRSLITGLCSISEDPGPDLIVDPEGLYTIFAKPYTARPRRIGWRDCRLENLSGVMTTGPVAWEGNWAAIPQATLQDPRVGWDEEYDRGHYYDNQALALGALRAGYPTVIDCTNHSISLPHKQYFPEQQAELERLNNRAFHEAKVGRAGLEQAMTGR